MEIANQFLAYFRLKRELPNYSHLQKIVRAFSHLPYENQTKLLKVKKSRTQLLRFPAEVWADYLKWGMGGTCFSLSFLLKTILDNCGFLPALVMAHRRYGENTHCVLVVPLASGDYLIDPGFLLRDPLPLGGTQPFPNGFNQIVIEGDGAGVFSVFTLQAGQRKLRYWFQPKPVPLAIFFQHWRNSFQGPGMKDLVVVARDQDRQIYLRGLYYREMHPDGVKTGRLTLGEQQQLLCRLGITLRQ